MGKKINWATVKDIVFEAKGQAKDLENQLEQAQRKREELFHAPPNRQDVKNMYDAFIAQKISQSHETTLSYVKSQLLFNRDVNDKLPHEMHPLSAGSGGVTQAGLLHAEHILAAIGPDRLKQWISEMVDSWEDWPGQLEMNLADRRAEIEKLDVQIEKLQTELDAIRGKMLEHGLKG